MIDLDEMKRDMEAGALGPWRVGPVDDCRVEANGGFEVAQIDGDYNHPDTWPIMEANARRIARVPDMEATIIALAAENATLCARVAKADGLAEAFAAVLELENNTSPFGGEIMRDRIERTVRKAVSALDAYRATEGAKP
jgi:hypothetical protein